MLIDRYLPEFQHSNYHTIEIQGVPADIYPVCWSIDWYRSRATRLLFTLRGLPRKMRTFEGFIDFGFLLLEENPPEEFVLGLLLHICKPLPVRVSPDEFRVFTRKHHVKVVMNFRLSGIGENLSLLSTESRIACTSRSSGIPFSMYWLVISRFSALTRIKLLSLVKQEAELQ